MNAIDAATILLVVVFTGLGVYQGFIKSASSLVALVGGLLLAKRFALDISHGLAILQVQDARGVLGLAAAFLLFFVAIKVLLHLTHKIMSTSVLAPFDMALGGAFGLAKGVIGALLVVAMAQVVLPKDSAVFVKSKTLPVTKKALVLVMGFVPEHMKPYIKTTGRIVIVK
ncbi:MAG TPA: CvpA family protein [Deltaproteobacteria bacterium]|mgnify:CR=1 FL=1|nr:CvpA family protein [Deltaproteobacteria bacterium]HPP79298.1 CvpA family protein [Deltaproteobacteria bacterium]